MNYLFFDLETTGLDTSYDQIVELSMIKTDKDFNVIDEFNTYVKPNIPISEEAEEIHGISNEKVKDAPTFCEIADRVVDMLKDSYIVGYNHINFDVPMLFNELLRCGKELDFEKDFKMIDVYKIYTTFFKRTLADAYKEYTGKELENAHSAVADVKATIEILKNQIERHNLPKGDELLKEFNFDSIYDPYNMFVKDEKGDLIFNFGKYKGRKLKFVLKNYYDYVAWLLRKLPKNKINVIINTKEFKKFSKI